MSSRLTRSVVTRYSLEGIAQAQQELRQYGETGGAALERVNRAARSEDIAQYGRGLDDLRAKYNPLFAASRSYKGQLDEINRALKVGAINEREHAAAITRTKNAFASQITQLRGVNTQLGRGVGAMRSQRGALQQLGFQVGDFAVQIGAGQSALLAFTQQGSQILQVFGPIGALLGAGVAIVGSLALAYTGLGRETETAKEETELFTKAQQEANDVLLEGIERAERAAVVKRAEAIATNEQALALKREALARAEARERAAAARRDRFTGGTELGSDASAAGAAADAKAASVEIARLRQDIDGLIERLDALRDKNPLENVRRGARETGGAARDLDDAFRGVIRTLDAMDRAEQRRRTARADSLAALEDEAALAERRLALAGAENVERAVELRLLKEIQTARRAGIELTTEEIAERRQLLETVERTNEELRQRETAEADARRASERESRARQRIAEREADLMAEPFKNALRGVQSEFSDTFEEILTGGTRTFEDLAAAAGRIMARLASELITLQFFGPQGITGIVGGGAGSAGSAGSAGAAAAGAALGVGDIASLGAGVFGSSNNLVLSGLSAGAALAFRQSEILGQIGAQIGGAFSPGAAAFLGNAGLNLPFGAVGSFGANLLGLGSGDFLIDTLAGTGGALLGGGLGATLFSGALGGPIGAAIGGFAGTALGGLFGGKPSVGPGGGITFASNGRIFQAGQGGDNGFNPGVLQPLADAALLQTNAILDAIGGRFLPGGASPIRELGFNQFAHEGGLTAIVGPSLPSAFIGRGRTFEGALDDFVTEIFKQAARGGALFDVDPNILTALSNSQAKTVAELVSDIEFAGALGGVTFGEVETTQAEQALIAINQQFAVLADRAQSLGLSLDTLDEAQDRAIAALTEDFDEAIRLQILAFTDPADGAMEALARAQEQRLREAEELGADLVQLERLNQLERQRAIAGGDIDALLADLTSGGLGQATGAQRLDAARESFLGAFGQVLAGGNVEDLVGTVRGFVDTSRSVNATGGSFGDDVTAAIELLQALKGAGPLAPLVGNVGGNVVPFPSGGSDVFRELVRLGEEGQLNGEVGSQLLRDLVAEIKALRRDLRASQPPGQVAV